MFASNEFVMEEKVELTISEKIDRAKDGRTQKWIVAKMTEILGEEDKITEVQFSRKKAGDDSFSENELKALSKVLKTKL